MKDMQADESVTGRFGRLNKNKIKLKKNYNKYNQNTKKWQMK